MTNHTEIHETRSLYEDELATSLGHPEDVLNHPGLSLMEKRSILAGWASDAHSVTGIPAVRQLPCGAIVNVDVILQALAAIDEDGDRDVSGRLENPVGSFPRRYRHAFTTWRRSPWSRHDDDDDPPPCPVASPGPRQLPLVWASQQRPRWA